MKRLHRILILSILLAMSLFSALPVHAVTLDPPTSYQISAVTVYSPALETGDQQWIVQYNIHYTTLPAVDAGEAWLIRLLDNGTEIASASPYPYYNSGYSNATASFYLPASLAPTWGSANLTVSLEPNPTLTWSSLPAQSLFASITWNSASTFDTVATAIGVLIRSVALGFNTSWQATSDPLIESINGFLKFTARGAAYFDVVMPYLRTIQPNLYQSGLSTPILVDNNYGTSGQAAEDAKQVGTPLDTTNIAGKMGLSRLWTSGLIWALFAVGVSGLIGYFAQTTKPVFFLFGAVMISGGFMGFGLFQSVMFGLLGAASVILAFAWRGA